MLDRLKPRSFEGDGDRDPGHTFWSHARGDVYSHLADMINAGVAA